MVFTRTRRWLMAALAVGIPFELAGALMLKHVPRIGQPRDPNPWLRFAGVFTALIQAPGLLLSDFLCVKFCPPNVVLQSITILGGYFDIVVLLLAATVFFRWLYPSSPR
jgi:hypothetical protein